MSPASVTWRRDGVVAVISVENPPVNALSRAVRAGLVDAVAAANGDREVQALVIRCAGRTFIAGADISEFARPPEAPLLPEVVQAIEDSAKPVVVALHGTALGGGFEVALAAHWRVADAGAKVGLPEVKLGIIPGAGGTQRLPRLVGAQRALEMITSGDPVAVTQAREWGAIDEIATGELDAAALAAARRLAAAGGTPRRTGALPAPTADPAVFAAAEAAAAKKRGLIAPRHAVAAVRAACELSFAEGVKCERALMLELRASPQAAALRHAFFGEREVAQVPGLGRDVPLRPVERVGVIGAGTMGGGIAMAFANAGFQVTLLEADAAALQRGLENVRRNYATSVQRGSLAEVAMQERLGRIVPTLEWGQLAQADLIIEAVFEDFEVKRGVLERMDAIARPGAILATNTSYLDVAKLAACTRRPQDVIGMHFFSPANVMRLLENVRTPQTAADVQATAMQVGRRLGKIAVMVGGSDGFVGNRMLAQRTREAFFLLEEGALPQQVDRVLVEFGFPMGPFAMGDLAGLDIGWRNRKARAHLRKPGVRDCNLLDQVCELGRLGQKTGAGWYRYESGQRQGQPDPLIEQLIVEHSRRQGIERRAIGDQEILERCVYSMINEGAKILEEGVAARPVDIDMVWLHGYGFPAYRGGPMFHAQQVGLAGVLRAIEHWRDVVGAEFWTPAPVLQRMVAEGRAFYQAT
jgi:3-hydroxyacyl-CoA dehydrogenase